MLFYYELVIIVCIKEKGEKKMTEKMKSLVQALQDVSEVEVLQALQEAGYTVEGKSNEKTLQFQYEKKECLMVCGDDWEALYINGILEDQDHSLSLEECIEKIGRLSYCFQEIIHKTLNEEGIEWLNNIGSLPGRLEEIPAHYFEMDEEE